MGRFAARIPVGETSDPIVKQKIPLLDSLTVTARGFEPPTPCTPCKCASTSGDFVRAAYK